MAALLFLCAATASAREAYVVFTEDETDGILTFYYDDLRETRLGTGMIYDLPTVFTNYPAWIGYQSSITKAVFDDSFSYARPISTAYWFGRLINLKTIEGISNLNTSKVKYMQYMFENCRSLHEIDVSGFDTHEVELMGSMFEYCCNLTVLDLSSWDTHKVTNMYTMFSQCFFLETIYCGEGWNTDGVLNGDHMFLDCRKLVGGMGTTYDRNNIDQTYARPDGGSSSPGYFTFLNISTYAVYTKVNGYNYGVLTFYRDGNKDTRAGTKYTLNTGDEAPGWFTDHRTDIIRVVFDRSFLSARPKSTCKWFSSGLGDTSYLSTIVGIEYLNTSEVTNMNSMFYGCGMLSELDVSGFDTGNVTDMNSMFTDCRLLTELDVSGFNTYKVTDMGSMFHGCSGLTALDVSSFNTFHTTKMAWMFYNCSGLGSLVLGLFDTHRVQSMQNMFYGCGGLSSLDVSALETDEVTDMSGMFYGCSGLSSLDLSDFTTRNVQDMNNMFYGCSGLVSITIDSSWNTINVTNMTAMFSGCCNLRSLDATRFNTRNVTSMANMFYGCGRLGSLDVSSWDTGKVTNVYNMFQGCSGLNSLDLSSWDTGVMTNTGNMFRGCSNLVTIWCGENWNLSNVTSAKSANMFLNCVNLKGGRGTTYNSSYTDKTYARADEGTSKPGYLTNKGREPYVVMADNVLTFWFDDKRAVWEGTENVLVFGLSDQWNNSCANVTKVVFDSSFATVRPVTTYSWFSGMRLLESIEGLSFLNTSEVTNMNNMFEYCEKLVSLDVSNFDTGKVTIMMNMFSGCKMLESLDVSGFNTSLVTGMDNMFYNCHSLKSLDVSNFDTGNVTNMKWMFDGLSVESLDVSHFNTSKVTDMERMFSGCVNLKKLDLTNFNTSKVTRFAYMFSDCKNLRTIYAGEGWSTKSVGTGGSTGVFSYCSKLKGGQGTTYSYNHDGLLYARIDGGPSRPGYFTDKSLIPTGIDDAPWVNENLEVTNDNDGWYSLDGRKHSGRPAVKGLYIKGGKKVVVK